MRFSSEISLAGLDASGNLNGGAINAESVFAFSVMVVTTGTVTGTLKVQYSNDRYTPGQAPTHWVDVPSASVAVAAAGTVGIPKFDACYNWLRVVWTFTANTGTITATVRTNGF